MIDAKTPFSSNLVKFSIKDSMFNWAFLHHRIFCLSEFIYSWKYILLQTKYRNVKFHYNMVAVTVQKEAEVRDENKYFQPLNTWIHIMTF